jgi:hypothetical protein
MMASIIIAVTASLVLKLYPKLPVSACPTSGNPAILYLQRHGYTSITQDNIEAAQHKLGLGQHVLLRYQMAT